MTVSALVQIQQFTNISRIVGLKGLTETRGHGLRIDHDREPRIKSILHAVHATDDQCTFFVVSGTHFVGPCITINTVSIYKRLSRSAE